MSKNEYFKKCLRKWDEFGSKKVVHKTDSLLHLKELYKTLKKAGINCILISDAVSNYLI